MTLRLAGAEIPVGPVVISVHFFFESLAYAVGFWIYRRQRRRGDVISTPNRNSVIVAAILGAAVGSKILSWLEDPSLTLSAPLTGLLGGKTIVGGLLGGTMAVEWVKKRLGILERTGDLFAIPIAVAIAVGRLGCFFGGLADRTYGSATTLPWAIDFGDGIPRHPTQIYEILFLICLTAALQHLSRGNPRNGELYRVFLVSYLAWRFAIDFLKPEPAFAGLSSIQWVCAAALIVYARDTARMFSIPRKSYVHG